MQRPCIIWRDHSLCGATNNSNNCIKYKINYLIYVAEIRITAIVCLSEWYLKKYFYQFYAIYC